MLEQNVPNPLASNPGFHTHKVFAAIGIILTVAIIAIGGIWYFVQSTEDKAPAAEEETTVKVSTSSPKQKTVTKEVEKDETADWKTYQGKLINLSLKYPSNWTVGEDNKGVYLGEYKEETGYIGRSNQEPEIILQDSANNRILKVSRRGDFIGSYSKPKEVDVIVSGISSKKSYWILMNLSENGSKPDTSVPTYSTILLSVNGTKFLIYGEWKEKDTEADKIFDQILSTFKFL